MAGCTKPLMERVSSRVRAPPLPPFPTRWYQALTVIGPRLSAFSSQFRHNRRPPRRKNSVLKRHESKKLKCRREQKAEKPKSRFRLELTRHNHRVVITDSIDKGRYVSYVVRRWSRRRRRK
jgi:hypothetical protein